MMRRLLVLGTVALAFVATACSGGSDLTLEQYFDKLHGLQTSFEQKGKDLQAELQTKVQGITTDAEGLPLFKGFLEDSLTAVDGLVDDLEAIDPPGEVQSQHQDFITAGKAIRDAAADVIGRFDEFTSVDEVAQLFTTDLADIGQQGTDACNALQSVADDNDINVDLSCG